MSIIGLVTFVNSYTGTEGISGKHMLQVADNVDEAVGQGRTTEEL